MKMRAKFFRFQFIIEILYKLRNFGIRNYKENRKQKFRKSKNRDFKFNKIQNQIPHQNLPQKINLQKTYGILSLYI
ncbi:hypothetical protein B9T53_29600 [Bacillus sp. KbaL1]|nr:hypothetical protein [Klebsiella pneumoniae]MBR9669972.1 hypothetical protein [Bacillus cereus]OXL91199.1 hypothetical protein B9T53_29600 [Bacillus sp. KbaL1]